MTEDGLLEIAQRIAVDEDYRRRFLVAPQEVLVDLGVSPDAYKALVAIVPILLAGGIGVFAGIIGEGVERPDIGWGR